MSRKDPAFEKSRSIEDLQHLRLTVLLEELVRDKGIMRAAGELNVDHRTLTSGLESGRLSRRLRGALEKALLEGGGSPAQEQRERNDELVGRVEKLEGQVNEMGEEMSRGLAAVQDEVKALGNEYTRDLQRVESRLTRVEGGGGDAEEEDGEPGGSRTPNRESSGGAQPKPRPRLRRELKKTHPSRADRRYVFGVPELRYDRFLRIRRRTGMWFRKQQNHCQPVCLAPKRWRKAISLPSPQYLYRPLSAPAGGRAWTGCGTKSGSWRWSWRSWKSTG